MEISNDFIEDLKRRAKQLPDKEVVKFANVSDAFPVLLEKGRKGENAKVTLNGKEYYSFMSEDEMYRTMSGKSKSEYLEQRKKEMLEMEKEQEMETKICQDAMKVKLPRWKKVIEQAFPPKMASTIIQGTCRDLEMGYVARINKMDKMVALIESAKTKPTSEVQREYLESYGDSDTRFFNLSDLSNSYYGDIFMEPIINDLKVSYKGNESTIQKGIETIVNNVLKAKAEKREKSGDDLDSVLGGDGSEKGKSSQMGSKKD